MHNCSTQNQEETYMKKGGYKLRDEPVNCCDCKRHIPIQNKV
jgi:hypothetical protein